MFELMLKFTDLTLHSWLAFLLSSAHRLANVLPCSSGTYDYWDFRLYVFVDNSPF